MLFCHCRFVITFTDGSNSMVSLADVLPLDLVKNNVLVTAMRDDVLSLPEVNGEYACLRPTRCLYLLLNCA